MTWTDTEHAFDDSKKIAEASTKWLAEMGQDELADTLNKAVSAFDIMVNACKVAGVAASLMSVKNAEAQAEAGILTSINSALGPIGWGNIAIATGAAVTAATLTGAIMTYELRPDLETPAGVEALNQTIRSIT